MLAALRKDGALQSHPGRVAVIVHIPVAQPSDVMSGKDHLAEIQGLLLCTLETSNYEQVICSALLLKIAWNSCFRWPSSHTAAL
ncbi:hypothetical protein SKAU_G00251540 [Synaphobranchus kaupii]|uniref:Uncharacterized protein n=1 Tax=Synaphobranchus kaupii TaxID=118154 RepID=A0A9Q1F2X9_SYNKA|nr:hypothetical protein SKAU_G00251540 [Synaphobranchus kaupii]